MIDNDTARLLFRLAHLTGHDGRPVHRHQDGRWYCRQCCQTS